MILDAYRKETKALILLLSPSFHVEGSVPHWLLWQAGPVPSEINVQLSVGTLG